MNKWAKNSSIHIAIITGKHLYYTSQQDGLGTNKSPEFYEKSSQPESYNTNNTNMVFLCASLHGTFKPFFKNTPGAGHWAVSLSRCFFLVQMGLDGIIWLPFSSCVCSNKTWMEQTRVRYRDRLKLTRLRDWHCSRGHPYCSWNVFDVPTRRRHCWPRFHSGISQKAGYFTTGQCFYSLYQNRESPQSRFRDMLEHI